MGILSWLFEKNEKCETMPDFRKVFLSLPNTIKATKIPPKIENAPSVQDRTAARVVAENKAKKATSEEKVKEVYARIQTARSRNKEIVWLLQTDKDFRYKSLNDLIENYANLKDTDLYRGMSVNYVSDGELHEIYPLCVQDLEGLTKKN
jgi:hypothetical protein